MVAPAKRATRQRARHEFNDSMRLAIVALKRARWKPPMLFIKGSSSVLGKAIEKGSDVDHAQHQVHSRVSDANKKTHRTWVTLQFGSCNALAIDFAPSSPIRLAPRLFHISVSSLSCVILETDMHSLYLINFAIWTLKCTRNWLCALVVNLIMKETVSYHSISSLLCLMVFNTIDSLDWSHLAIWTF